MLLSGRERARKDTQENAECTIGQTPWLKQICKSLTHRFPGLLADGPLTLEGHPEIWLTGEWWTSKLPQLAFVVCFPSDTIFARESFTFSSPFLDYFPNPGWGLFVFWALLHLATRWHNCCINETGLVGCQGDYRTGVLTDTEGKLRALVWRGVGFV